MANGKPGDHPLTDILIYGREIYGKEADALIRKIAELCSQRELNEWWDVDVGWDCKDAEALRKATAKHQELVHRAKERGWECNE